MIPGLRFQMVSELKEKSKAVIKLHPNSRIAYAVFSKSGFSGNADAADKDKLLMDLGDTEKSLERIKSNGMKSLDLHQASAAFQWSEVDRAGFEPVASTMPR